MSYIFVIVYLTHPVVQVPPEQTLKLSVMVKEFPIRDVQFIETLQVEPD